MAILLATAPVAAPVAALEAPRATCRITDDRLVELSGLVTTPGGYVVVNDGADDASGRRIFYLDQRCKVVRTVKYPSRPRDTEDLAQAPDGTLYVGDIGDNGQNRETVALWRLTPGARTPKIFRLAYPDGPHDAEALLAGADGTPVIVTKDPVTAGVYVPDGPPRAGTTTPLRRAGSVSVPMTGTSNPFGFAGHVVITGGAVSADGTRAALRTYADAFVYDVPDGDLIRALTGGSPRQIALPDEPQGESIAFSPDGTALVTVSELADRPAGTAIPLLRYPLSGLAPAAAPPASSPAAGPATSSPSPSAAVPAPAAAAQPGGGGLPTGAVIAGVALLGGALCLLVAVLTRRRRGGA